MNRFDYFPDTLTIPSLNVNTPTFFEPDDEMVQWIIKQANNRFIFDIGYGNGFLIKKLLQNGYNKVMGCDPMTDASELSFQIINDYDVHIHLLQNCISDKIVREIVLRSNDNMFFILARPCHHPLLTKAAIELCHNKDLIYIGHKENIKKDLHGRDYKVLKHKGSSVCNEIVLKIKT